MPTEIPHLLEATGEFESLFRTVSCEIGCKLLPGEQNVGAEKRGDGLDWSRAPNGECYVTVTSCGIKPEGDRLSWLAETEDEAIIMWLRRATEYAADRRGTLWWRIKPEICVTGTPRVLFDVYSRFLVT